MRIVMVCIHVPRFSPSLSNRRPMPREVPLNELDAELDQLSYPIDREEVRSECADVVLHYADGTESLGDVLDRIGTDRFDSRDELVTEIYNELPREAVGEPFQSEGEG